MVILSNEMTALRMGDGIGATASRMRVIFMSVVPMLVNPPCASSVEAQALR